MKSIHKLRLLPSFKLSNSCGSVCLSVCMASGGVHGQPVWGGAELQRCSTTTHPQPLLQPRLQPFLQPLLQPGGPAGRQHQVARLWEIYFYGERDAKCAQNTGNRTLVVQIMNGGDMETSTTRLHGVASQRNGDFWPPTHQIVPIKQSWLGNDEQSQLTAAAAEARQFRLFNSSLSCKLNVAEAIPMNLNMSLRS